MATFSTPSLLVLLSLLIVFADAQPAEPVLDQAGEPVRSGVQYYIIPAYRTTRPGVGLSLAPNRNGTCPLDVVLRGRQQSGDTINGVPVTFFPVNPREGVVRTITDQNIKFSPSSAGAICPKFSTVWTLGRYEESMRQAIVSTGGVVGNPGPATLSNWFRIEKYEDSYKIVFCPSVCDVCRVICGDIGIFNDNGVGRLAMSTVREKPALKIMFKKVV